MLKRTRILTLILAISLLSLTSCAYRPPVQQGNFLTNANIQSIHQGMTKSQVLGILGKPVLINLYKNGRLVYVYTLEPTRRSRQMRKLLIYFRSGRVTNYEVYSSPNLEPPKM